MTLVRGVDSTFAQVVEVVEQGSYLGAEGAIQMGCLERLVRWLFSWTSLVDSVALACAKRSLEFIKETHLKLKGESTEEKDLFDRCQLLRSMYGDDLSPSLKSLEAVSKTAHDVFFSYLSLDHMFSGFDNDSISPPTDEMCTLAELYMRGGTHVEKETQKALELLGVLSRKKVPRALFLLSELYYRGGDGMLVDHPRALESLREAVRGGYPPAEFQLGCLHRDGYGVESSQDEARRLFRLASSKGYEPARLALEGMRPTNVQQAMVTFRQLFSSGSAGEESEITTLRERAVQGEEPQAQIALARRLISGDGVEQPDRSRAIELLTHASVEEDEALDELIRDAEAHTSGIKQQGEASSLAIVPFHQRGAPITDERRGEGLVLIGRTFLRHNNYAPEKAVRCFERGMEKGSQRARLALAKCYDRGEGVVYDQRRAFLMIQEAARAGYTPAKTEYANYLLSGCGRPMWRYYLSGDVEREDTEEAVRILEEASAEGDLPAMFQLAMCAKEGKGMPKDPQREIELLQRAIASAGDSAPSNALRILGEYYEKGHLHLPQNFEAARALYLRASNRGNILAKLRLAEMLERGSGGVDPNPQQAFEFYQQAYEAENRQLAAPGASYSSAEATFHFARCHELGIGCEINPRAALRLFHLAARRGSKIAWEELRDIYQHRTRLRVSAFVQNPARKLKEIKAFLVKVAKGRLNPNQMADVFADPFEDA